MFIESIPKGIQNATKVNIQNFDLEPFIKPDNTSQSFFIQDIFDSVNNGTMINPDLFKQLFQRE